MKAIILAIVAPCIIVYIIGFMLTGVFAKRNSGDPLVYTFLAFIWPLFWIFALSTWLIEWVDEKLRVWHRQKNRGRHTT